MTRTAQAVIFTLLLGIFTAQSAYLAFTNSTISDEVAHIGAGYSYLKYHDYRLNMEHPPLAKQISAIPLLFMDLKFPLDSPAWREGNGEQWEVGRSFLFKMGNPAEKIIPAARLALLPLAFLLALGLFLWTRDILGPIPALFSVFLYILVPDIVIHASLVGTDFTGTVFYFLTFYFLYRSWVTASIRELTAAAVSAGLALLSKFSMLQIIPLFLVISAASAFKNPSRWKQIVFPIPVLILTAVFTVTDKTSLKIFILPVLFMAGYRLFPKLALFRHERLNKGAALFLFLISVAFLVVALGYFEAPAWFEKFRPFKRFFRGWAIFRDHSIKLQHPGYLFGNYDAHGWRYYYLIAMLVKIPLSVWIFSLTGFFAGWRNRFFTHAQWAFLVIPPAIFLLIASFINHVNIGVRHVLPVYPFMLIFAAAGFSFLWNLKHKWCGRGIALLLSLWLIFSAGSAFPNYIPYFNELARIWGGGDKILSDSNISWGQDIKRLRDYILKNNIPEVKTLLFFNFAEELDYYKLPWKQGQDDFQRRVTGVYVVDVFIYQKIIGQAGFKWLRGRKPDARAGGSLLIYRI